jgi:hypothetical protein
MYIENGQEGLEVAVWVPACMITMHRGSANWVREAQGVTWASNL